MTHVHIADGHAYVTEDEHDCYECGARSASGLTKEAAYAAALELLELATSGQLITEQQVELGAALDDGFFALFGEHLSMGLIQIPGFVGPFDKVSGSVASIEFGTEKSGG